MADLTLDQIGGMLQRAHAAGDTANATRLAQAYQQMQAQQSQAQPPAAASAQPSMDPNDPNSPNNPANGNFSFSPFGIDALGTYNMPQGLGRYMAGVGESAVNSGRSLRQMAAYLTGNTDWQNQLDQEEAQARQLDAPLNATTGGSAGRISGEAAQMLLPAGELTKAAQLYKMGTLGVMGAGAAAGAVQGALQPTTGDESRGMNVLGNAAVGGAIPIVPQAVGGVKGLLLKMLTGSKGTGFGTSLAGQMMGNAVEGQNVNLDVQGLKDVAQKYGTAIPEEVRQLMGSTVREAQNSVPGGANVLYQGPRYVTGDSANDLYSALTQTANAVKDVNPTGAQAMNAAKRVVDASQQSSLTAARYNALKLGRRAVSAGVSPYGMMTSGALLNAPLIQALNNTFQRPPDNSGAQTGQ